LIIYNFKYHEVVNIRIANHHPRLSSQVLLNIF